MLPSIAVNCRIDAIIDLATSMLLQKNTKQYKKYILSKISQRKLQKLHLPEFLVFLNDRDRFWRKRMFVEFVQTSQNFVPLKRHRDAQMQQRFLV